MPESTYGPAAISDPVLLETKRLCLRPWRPDDYEPFAAMSRDPEVMRYLGPLADKAASDALADRFTAHFAAHGWGFWVVETKADSRFAGTLGLHNLRPELPFAPGVEIGWRLAREFWGKGYATEGARAALEFGFSTLGLAEIVAYAVPVNTRSRAVMERIGMRLTDTEFDHPLLPQGHSLSRHCLYSIRRGN